MAKAANQFLEWADTVLPTLKSRIEATRRTVERTHRRLAQVVAEG